MSINKLKTFWFTMYVLICAIICFSLFTVSSIPGYKRYEHYVLKSYKIESTFVDAQNNLITNTEDNSRGKERALLDEYSQSYAWLIGTNEANQVQFGLREKLKNSNYGFLPHKTKLTTDNMLMTYCYDLLNRITDSGSIIVMDHSGEIKAMVSRSPVALDINNIELAAKTIEESGDKDSFIMRGLEVAYPPGSVFKIVTAAALLENNVDLNYYDTGVYKSIHNYADRAYAEVDLNLAIANSLNTYPAQKTVENLGIQAFEKKCKDFMIGETIELDFGILTSSNELTNDNLAFTSFGQGALQTPDLLIAMWMNGVANDGKMYLPHVLKSTHSEVISQVCNPTESAILKEALNTAALAYGLPDYCIAKSGTAELDQYGNVHTYLLADDGYNTYLISSDPSISVISSVSLYEYMNELIAYSKSIMEY